MSKRKRRIFSPDFKTEAVRLVVEEGRSVNDVAKSLELYHSTLASWVKKAQPAPRNAGAPSAEQLELRELKKRVRQLEMEREILKKAALDSMGHCNSWLNTFAGVSKSSVFRGRWFSRRAIFDKSVCV